MNLRIQITISYQQSIFYTALGVSLGSEIMLLLRRYCLSVRAALSDRRIQINEHQHMCMRMLQRTEKGREAFPILFHQKRNRKELVTFYNDR